MPDRIETVAAEAWRDAIAAALIAHPHFDWLGAVDEWGRADEIRVVCRLRGPSGAVRLETRVPRDGGVLASVRDLIPGADWHEREAAEFLGLTFAGGDNRRLLLRPDFVGHPLRADVYLTERIERPWPGARDAGPSTRSRRRQLPPGVPADAASGPGERRRRPR